VAGVDHRRRLIVHRDIKPANLLLCDGDPGRTKVLDFGIARLAWSPRAFTGVGTLLGTPGYMAPEQARGETALRSS
jgi:serine/threonine protein kinase